MKWKNLYNYILIAVFALGISIAIIYCFQQNIKANESEEELQEYKDKEMTLGSIPEIKNSSVLHWDIKGLKELQRWTELRNKIIKHYDLEGQYYKDNEYVDVFISDYYFVISDKKYQKKMNNSEDYELYAIDMREHEKGQYFKLVDEELKRSYEKLL